MTTARDIVTSALRQIQVLGARDPVDSDDMTIGLERLNDMLASWAGRGVDTGHYPLDEGQTFPLEERHVRGVKALLAREIAPDFGVGVPEHVAEAAFDGWIALQAEYIVPPDASFDNGLVRVPSRRLVEI